MWNVEKDGDGEAIIEIEEPQLENSESVRNGEERLHPQPKKKKRRIANDDKYDLMKMATEVMRKPMDEFQIFGDFVASEFRSLRSKDVQRQLKLTIQRAIIQFAEIDGTTTNSNADTVNSNSTLASTSASTSPLTHPPLFETEFTAAYYSQFASDSPSEKPETALRSIPEQSWQLCTPESEKDTSMSDTNYLQQL